MSAIELDERLGRSVLLGLGGVVVEGRGDLLGKLLAELDAPLVVRVDAPDRALDKRDVLVQGDELAKRERGQRVTEDRGRRAVALKATSRDDLFGRALGTNLVGCLAKGECLGLGQEVAQEQLVDVLAAVGCGVGSVGESDKSAGTTTVPWCSSW